MTAPPSEVVFAAIRRNLMGRRRDRTRLMFFQGAAAILAVSLIAAVALGLMAEHQRRQAIAEAYGNAAYSYSASDPTLALRLGQISIMSSRTNRHPMRSNGKSRHPIAI